MILAGFMRILTPVFVDRFAGKLLNIHPSLLPKYPGLHTHQRAIDAGDSEAGATVHYVTSELDGGPPRHAGQIAYSIRGHGREPCGAAFASGTSAISRGGRASLERQAAPEQRAAGTRRRATARNRH